MREHRSGNGSDGRRRPGWRGRGALALAAAWLVAACALIAAPGPANAAPALGDRPLELASSGPDVAELQRLLTRAGVYTGPVTGYFGPLTRGAVLEFQRRAGLPQVGIAGPQTVRALTQPRTGGPAQAGQPGSPGQPPRINPRVPAPDGDPSLTPQARAAQASRPAAPEVAPIIVYRPPAASAPASTSPAGSAGTTAASPDAPPGGGGPAAPVKGLLALTFNDGPDPAVTPRILELLRRHQARATFFLIGERVAARPDLVLAIAAEGHEIGNHGYTEQPLAGRPRAEQARELERAGEAILSAGGGRPKWFRPAGGLIDDETLAAAGAQGLRLALWTNIGPQNVPGQVILRRARSAARDGAILLIKESDAAVEVLEQLLPALRGDGFSLVTLSELEARD